MTATLSAYIKNDLMDRIGAGLSPPAELTLPALARHYGVSFTPVREALRDLVDLGVLVKRDNGRVLINPARPGSERSEAGKPSSRPLDRSAELEESLVAEVIARSLLRRTDYLREEATAQRLGVGRTALRQALNRLAGRGLIVHVPRCGWRVRPFDEADLEAYLNVREVLELRALELARPHLVAADLQRMLAGNSSEKQSPRLNNDIHHYLIVKAGNPYIRDFFERHSAYYTTLFDFAAPETHVVAEMSAQHRAILQALIERDWPGARRALTHHIRAQKPIVQEWLRRLDHRDPSPEGTPI